MKYTGFIINTLRWQKRTNWYLFSIFIILTNCNAQERNNMSYEDEREIMVRDQIEWRGVDNKNVLNAMKQVPRHVFVPNPYKPYAYDDTPLPIGEGQTISQPYIVAYMTEILDLKSTDKVLEIGTGSGYQAAVLAEICDSVYTIEIYKSLAERAGKILKKLGYDNVFVKHGDGYKGWPEHAPFDAIIVTCAPRDVPEELEEQLKENGRMIIPVGKKYTQQLYLLKKKDGKIREHAVLPVRFVPMIDKDGDVY